MPRPSARSVTVLVLLAATATTSWLVLHHLGDLPRTGTTTNGAEEQVWLYYWHHTSTWWAALATVVGTLTSVTLGAWLLRLVVRFLSARSKIAGALVAVVGWAAWLCGTAFLCLLALVVWMTADLEGTQTSLVGPDGRQVLVALTNNGYYDVDVWRQDTATRFVLERGAAAVDPRSGPCALTRSDEHLLLVCGTTSQTLEPR